MRQRCFSVVLAATLAAGWASPARAVIGLAARFGDVVLENVAPGRTYNLREAAHVPFGMQNIGDAPVTIEVDFSFPSKAQLSKNYEPIPDPSWLKAIPNTLTIGPHSIGFFDLLLSVPDDPKLKGKNFEVMVTGRMKGSGMLALAVENKIRFS
ncbi:MAG: hypothetical protein KGK30_07970, partial [Elusimicrobia bacterium]|nr:hypothetical protein [Elusimicrobiota bacterium]